MSNHMSCEAQQPHGASKQLCWLPLRKVRQIAFSHARGLSMLQAQELAPDNGCKAQQCSAQAGSTAANGSAKLPAATANRAAVAQMGSAQLGSFASQAAASSPRAASTRTLSGHSSVGAAPPPWPSPPRLRPTAAANGTANGRPSSETAANGAQRIDGIAPHPVIRQVKQLAAKAARELQNVDKVDPVAWKRHGITDGRQSSVLSDSASSDGTQS
jgi:hypothetical protein